MRALPSSPPEIFLTPVSSGPACRLFDLDAEGKWEHREDAQWESLFLLPSSAHCSLQLKLIHKFTAARQL